MALRYYTMSYGSPGDVENNRIIVPKTLTEFEEKAKEAKEKTGFIKITSKGRNADGSETASKEGILNPEAVEAVFEVE